MLGITVKSSLSSSPPILDCCRFIIVSSDIYMNSSPSPSPCSQLVCVLCRFGCGPWICVKGIVVTGSTENQSHEAYSWIRCFVSEVCTYMYSDLGGVSM